MIAPVHRILIIKPSALGDIVQGLPILHGLRAVHPDAHIAWMVRPAYADVIRGHPALDEVIEFDRKYFGRFGRSWPATRDFVRWLIGLARRRFDLVVDVQGLFRSGLFALATLAPRRMGFSRAREFGWLFYNQRVRPAPGVIHAVDRNYLFAAPLGFAHIPPTFELPIGEPARASVRRRLAEAGLPPDRPVGVLVPGSTWGSKRWPADRFARVAENLADRGMAVILSGAPNETDVAAAVRQSCRAKVLDWSGRTNLKEVMALLERAAIVVTNDSGPMHLAAALGRPMVAVFGPTDPARTGPYGRPDTVVRAVDDTRHHFRHNDNSAIAAVTVEAVLAAVDRQLQTSPRSG